ncbi:PKD domain-containing protein [Haliscomenobacter sp.]|uniref:Ig-like domain-containing protein n=1 Tax=Haliscomenobacter sp. TaxID=2717303 RepID=UPI0035932E06
MKYLMNIDHTFRHCFAQQFSMWRLLLLLLCAPSLSYATHIVGGEVGYRCLGNDRYEIIVRVYRDCAPKTEPFDPVASVGIFDRNGLLLQDVRIDATSATPLDNNLDACIQATTNVCVETMTYKATVNLPFRTGGYQIVYQRCCRNATIKNIVSPLETGATYDVWLTEAAMRRCNNSAMFRRWPDIYICNTRPLDFDHSAFDVDGDSLVYRLCTPFQGATFANPRPQPPNFPPYDTLIWVKPLYNLYNMLGAVGEPLRINSVSGLLTARPGILGQFVVGICVDEYDPKTKQLISSTRRDFQYNVQNCEGVTAAFFAPESQCDSLKVRFRNESVGASKYLWLFDAPRTTLTSTEVNPIYTFPAYNTYKVSLIAEPNTTCADTFSRQVKLFKSGIKANFKAEVLSCAAESIIRLQDLSTDSSAAIVKRIWKVTFGVAGQITATGADTLVRLPSNVSGIITLTVVNANGCEKTTTQNFSTAGGQNPTDGIPDTIRACVGSIVTLNPAGTINNVYSYRWTPTGLIDSPNIANPRLLVTQDAVVVLTLTANSAQTCTFTKTITIFATPRPVADFSADGGIGNDPIVVSSCDGRTLNLTNKSTNADSVKWIIGDVNNPILVSTENNPALTLADTGTYTLTLIAYGECNDTLQKTIRLVKQETDVDFTFNYTNCILNGSTIKLLDVSNNAGIQIASRTWKLSDGRTSTEDSPSFTFTDTGRVTVTLVIRTTQGCLDSASQSIVKAPITGVDFPDTIVLCRGMPLQIPGNNNPNLVYMWLPETGLDDPTVGNPIFSPQQSTQYTVNISVPGIPACQTTDSMMAIVPGNMGITVLGAGADGTPVCTPQTTLTASANRPVTFRWLDANGNQLGTGPTFTATVATQRNLTVEATDENGCKEKLEISLIGDPVVFAAPDSVILCTNEPLRINTTQGPGQILTYSWTPVAAFESGALTANPLLAATPGIKEVFVQVRNASGCVLSDSVQVIIIDANHNLDFTPEIQCDGNTVIFRNTSTNAFGYRWNFGDGTTSTEESPSHSYAEPGNYTVSLTLSFDVACRKTVTKEISITVGSAIGLKVPNNLTTCGEDVTLTAEGKPGTTFKWTTKQGQLLSSNASVSVNPPPGTTVYYVTATNALGCTETDSVSVTDNGVDVTLVTPSGSNQIDQCDAENVQVEVRNNAPGQLLTYSWTPASNVVSGGNTATPVLRPTEIGRNVIIGIVSNQFECEDTLTVVINLGTLDSGLPDTVKVCPGVATPLAPNASAEFSYQWGPATGLSATNVRNPSFTGTTPVTYLVTVTKTSGGISCQVVDTVVITISAKPVLGVSTMDTTACVGTTLQLVATGASEYAWIPEGSQETPIFQGDGGIAISGTQGTDTRYTVIGRNAAGCTDTISGIRVRFVDFNPGQFTTPLTICKGDTVELHPTGNPAFQYQWSPSAGLDLTKPYNPVALLGQTTRFLITITDPITGCFKERAIVVNVNAIEGFTASNDTTICTATGGLTLRADANGNNVNFRWLNAAGTQIGTGKTISVNPTVGDNLYIVEATNGTCTARDTVKVTLADFKPGDLASPQSACAGEPLALNPNGNPAYTYIWSPATGLDLTNTHNPIATLNASITYSVTVSDPASGCTLEKEIRVNVIDLSDLAIVPSDTTVCQPGGVNLRVTGATGANIRWLDANGTQIGTGRSISPSPNVGLNLYIAEASVGSCTARDTSRVTRADFQPGDLKSPQAACAGEPLALNPNGNPAYTYAWSPTIGLNLTNPHNPIATLVASVTYTVTVTDPVSGCTLEKEIRVNVTDLSDLTIAPADTTVCQPGGVNLRVTGAEGANIRWLDANGTQIGTGRSISPSPNVGLNLYIAEASVGSCTARDTSRVTRVDFQPGDLSSPQAACAGSPLALNPNGNPAYTYVWSPTIGLNLTNPHNPIATLVASVTYTVIVTDPATGCSIEKEIRVNVTDLGDLEAIPSETVLCQRDFVFLTARGAQGATIRWLDANGQVIFNGRNLSVTPGLGLNLYIVEATLGTCSKRDTARIRLSDFNPGDLKSPQNICVGTSVELNPNGNPAYTYTWSPTTGLDLSKPFNPLASPTNTTTYTVTVTDPATGCSATKSIVVNVTQPVTVIALPDTSLCEPGRLTLRATTSRPTPITWFSDAALKNQIGTGNRISVNVAAGKTVFYAVATDTNDVCIRAQIDSARNGGGTPGTGGGPTIGDGGPFEGAPLDSAVVDVVDITSGAPPSMITTCAGRPTPINPNGKPNLVYRWSPARGLNDSTSATPTTIVTVPTTYTVTISDPFGACSIVRQVVVMAAEPIRADAGKDTTLCSLNPFNLTASGNGAAIFEWSNNRNISPVLGQGAQFSITPDTVARTYYVRITNAAGCVEIDSVTVIARPVRASLPATVNACENGDEVTLIVTNGDPRQTLTYLWSPANLFITDVRTGPSATIVAQNGAQPQVLLTNQYGCTATLRTTVNVVDLANKVRVTANPTTIENGESTTIRVENCPDCTYSWSPATGLNTTTGSTVIASPTDTTEYTVRVTSNGCTTELKITINVAGPYCIEPYIFVPTAFTPNRDGVNDVLYVRGRGIDRMTFIIYNRWGQKMFETSDPKVGWDGTFRGKQLPPDVYGFYLLANCIDGSTYRKQGNVTLIR